MPAPPAFSSILIPLDGSALSERALPYAVRLARSRESRIVLVRATDPGHDHVDGLVEAEAYLESIAQRVGKAGVRAEPAAPTGEAAPTILSEIELRDCDLVVMSTHGRSGLGRWIYGSVADRVLRRADVPVLLVPATCDRPWPPRESLRLTVTLDGSHLAFSVLEPARRLATALQAELQLLQVVVPPMEGVYADAMPYTPFDRDAEQAAARAGLEEVARDLRAHGLRVTTHAAVGRPAATIAHLALAHGSHLIAMATHGRGGLARLVLGSVASDVLQRSSIPLLVVRPDAAAPLSEPVSCAGRPARPGGAPDERSRGT